MLRQDFFVGGHAALDFLNSLAAPHGEWIESIVNGEAYLSWLADAGLLKPDEVQKLLAIFGKPALDQVAVEARELREWFRQVIMKSPNISGYWRTASTIAKLNNLLAMDCLFYQLEMHDKQLALREWHRYTQARQFLIPIALSIAELIVNGDLALIKCCANPPCTLWFYDRTKGHRRRFCSITICGNRIKVAAFRLRQRKAK